MSVSPTEKKRYFAETALALRREGFHVKKVLGGQLLYHARSGENIMF